MGMKIEYWVVDKKAVKSNMQEGRPFIRISKGKGCGCCMRKKYWISMANGKVGLTCFFDSQQEFAEFMRLGEIK